MIYVYSQDLRTQYHNFPQVKTNKKTIRGFLLLVSACFVQCFARKVVGTHPNLKIPWIYPPPRMQSWQIKVTLPETNSKSP